jgi:rare lipoprotein A
LLLPATILAGLLLHGCSSSPPASVSQIFETADGAPAHQIDFDAIPDAVPRAEPPAKWGNAPYTVFGRRYQVMDSSRGFVQRGQASWYGTKYHGRTTSSGEVYDMYAMSAAHNHLPLPTYLEVTNLDNGRSVIVKVNDRGPFHGDRILDLSYAAAGKLGMVGKGVAPVVIRAIDTKSPAQQVAKRPSAPKLAGSGGYLLQVAAFSSRQNADSLRYELQHLLDYDIQVRPANSGQRPLYKVQIGPLDYNQAENATYRLAQLGYTETQVLVD